MKAIFEMTDLGLMKYFLGLEIAQTSLDIFISRVKYAGDILKKFKLNKCKKTAIPPALNEKVSKQDGVFYLKILLISNVY